MEVSFETMKKIKRIVKLGMSAACLFFIYQGASANGFKTNDLYVGFCQSSAQDDYDIDLGQPGVVGVGGTSVVDLSSAFSLTVFDSVFVSGAIGVDMAVVGGNTTFNKQDVYTTVVRTSGFGNPGAPGSSATATNSLSAISGGATTVASILSNSGGLPTAGNYVLDSTKSYSSLIATEGTQKDFAAKTGIYPIGTFGSSKILYLDLWEASLTNIYTYLGYFMMDLSTGTPKFTFTPAAVTSPAPTAAFSGTPTAGGTPLQVVFTDASTGSITNWQWNLGDGHSVTNKTSANVIHTYSSAGSYTVSLTVSGTGGTNMITKANYVVVSSGGGTPKFTNVVFSSGKLVFSGINGSAGAQYRILTSTNVAQGTWTPVFTNNFLGDGSFAYTNNSTTNIAGFFRLVSP